MGVQVDVCAGPGQFAPTRFNFAVQGVERVAANGGVGVIELLLVSRSSKFDEIDRLFVRDGVREFEASGRSW